MYVLYHLTFPRPSAPALDAVVQEAEALRAHAGGSLIYVNPALRPGSRFPERLYGLHRLPYLLWQEAKSDLHHVYNAHLYPFPYLRWLKRPVIYTVAAGLRVSKPPSYLGRLAALARIVVTNSRDLATLYGWGLRNVEMVRPGMDITRLMPQPLPAGPLTLLMGSAPWTPGQFVSKGVDALLAAAKARPDLRLIFLWRGLHLGEMERRIAQSGLEDRVTVINRHVDINDVLAQVHAAAVLASDPTLVKAFPHSLMEALAAGRPVLVSRAIPMAEYIEQTGCGVVVERVDVQAVLAALDNLTARYQRLREAALALERETFSLDRLKRAYSQIYRAVITGGL